LLSGETVLAFQSVFLVLLFVSIAFRMKGNYLVHGIIMIVAVATGWVALVMTVPDFMNSSYTQTITNPSSTFALVGSHVFLGVATLVSVTWLIALWRPKSSTDFAAKSKRIWQSNAILWVLAYVVGLMLFLTLHTSLFG
jgi:hypothetical protein